jgi:SagB-type dehydrogenase family enzyme
MEVSARTARPGSDTHPGARATGELFRLRSDARLISRPDGVIVLQQDRFEAEIAKSSAGCRAMLLRLAEQWTGDAEIYRVIAAAEGERGIMQGQLLLRRLVMHSWLRRRLTAGDRPLLDIAPVALGADALPHAIRHTPQTGYRLSRFVTASVDETGLVARTPLSTVSVAFPDSRLAGLLVPAATGGCTCAELAGLAGLDQPAAGAVLDELLTARILVSPAECQAETSEPPKAVWATDELSLHARARTGRHALPTGGTCRFRGQFPAEPLRRTAPDGASPGSARRDLEVPDLGRISRAEPSLTEVITRRRSIRSHDEASPITDGQLAEFLYRVQHTSQVRQLDDGQEVGARPYPAGGQLCELEVYPLISECAGLESGLYHYDSIGHRLTRLAALHPAAHRMLTHAQAAAMMAGPPQVLLVITARVQRLLWKYEGMGYVLALKNSGVLTGLMYLVATAMGLAPCALGSGDSAAFALLSGLDPLIEPSIADFALGTRAVTS